MIDWTDSLNENEKKSLPEFYKQKESFDVFYKKYLLKQKNVKEILIKLQIDFIIKNDPLGML